MDGFIRSFGFEWHILLAQFVNFAILLFVLKRFAYKPITRMLSKRQEQIKADEEHSKELAQKAAEAEKASKEILQKTIMESETIIKKARQSGKELALRVVAEGRAESEKIIAAGRKTLSEERARLAAEIKQEIGELVTLAVEKVVGGAVDKQSEGKLVEEAVRIIKETKQGRL